MALVERLKKTKSYISIKEVDKLRQLGQEVLISDYNNNDVIFYNSLFSCFNGSNSNLLKQKGYQAI